MVSRLEVEAGWYAVLRVPALESQEDLALRLIRDHGVSIHPGYFFGFGGGGWLVVSLLTQVSEFTGGIDAICSLFNEMGDELKA
jgi:aspartate/methionine/tyrosine aminotransferase